MQEREKGCAWGGYCKGDRRFAPTVCVSLKALAEEGYILMDEAHEVHLTEKGMRIAKETYERHNTFCQLLTGLGADEKTAASDACEMEHAVSAENYRALKALVAEGNGGA